ncbi:MAG: TrmH family RNA methyltransferase [Chloroflexota bacterium]
MRSVDAVQPDAALLGPAPSAVSRLRGERAEGIKHPAVALARSLKGEAGRVAAGLFIVHGSVLLQRALAAGAAVALVLYTPRLLVGPDSTDVGATLRLHNVPYAVVSEGIMRTIVERAYVPELIALVARRLLRPAAVPVTAHSLFLLANDLTNPSNLGMLVRTAYGAGVEALFLTSGTTDPFAWQVSTGSTGAIFHLPFVAPTQPADLIDLRAKGVRTVAAVANAERDYTDLDYRDPICIMVGNEAHGLTAEIAALADVTVRVPMAHQLDSLNVAVAAGVLLFEAQRQRRETH